VKEELRPRYRASAGTACAELARQSTHDAYELSAMYSIAPCAGSMTATGRFALKMFVQTSPERAKIAYVGHAVQTVRAGVAPQTTSVFRLYVSRPSPCGRFAALTQQRGLALNHLAAKKVAFRSSWLTTNVIALCADSMPGKCAKCFKNLSKMLSCTRSHPAQPHTRSRA
jgi:hypothetical protein